MRPILSATILLLTTTSLVANGCGTERDNSCAVNADCADSQAADDLRPIRCAAKEIYCLGGTCRGECRERCEVVRDDVNPCSDPRQCAHFGGSEDDTYFCTMLPVSCEVREDCPRYRTILEGGSQGEWACEDGECTYPDYVHPTH